MSADAIVAVVTLLAALVLAARGLGGRRLDRNRTLTMAAAWIAIIAVLAFVLKTLGV